MIRKIFFILLLSVFSFSCGKDPAFEPELTQEHWWDYYLKDDGSPVELPSGFKLVSLSSAIKPVTPVTMNNSFIILEFVIDPDYRSNRGFILRGNNQNADEEDLAGAVEFIKQGGYLRVGEAFDWQGSGANEHRINRFNQPPMRSTFNGVAYDLLITLLSEPYIMHPTDTTRIWSGKPTYVSDGTREFQETNRFGIEYLGRVELVADGSRKVFEFQDVIRATGRADQGGGHIEAYLAPDAGIFYYHLVTAFGQEGAGALIGYNCENQDLNGATVQDYFPTAPGNHWIYEFAADERVAQFRFKLNVLEE